MRKLLTYKLINKVHIYSGLFAAVFFLIAGISALNFQHRFINTGDTSSKEYSRNIKFDGTLPNDTLALSIKDSLNVIGHVPWWKFKEDSLGNFNFNINRPARRYEVSLNRNISVVKITEVRMGFGNLLNSLHIYILGQPKSWIFILWAIYAQIAIVAAIIAVGTSIYIWAKKSIRRRSEWLITISAAVLSIIVILYLWLVG